MTMTLSRRRPQPAFRAPRSTRARFALEALEERTVLSQMIEVHGMAAVADVARALHGGHVADVAKSHDGAHAAAKAKAAAKKHSAMTVTGLVINDVTLATNNQLIANATLNGTVKGHAISLPLTLPVSLSTTPPSGTAAPAATTGTATQVLYLSLGPVNLSLLGLNVHLGSSCTIGSTSDPITATITAIPSGSTYTSGGTTYAGGLLGDLLTDVDNLLSSGSPISGLGSLSVPGVTGSPLDALETDLTSALNQIFSGLNSSNSAATGHTMAAAAGQHEVLDLDLNPINLDVLGALIQTSSICLNLTASPGPGNLLGNLLG